MANETDQSIIANEKYSVRQFAPNTWGGFIGDSMGFLWPSSADILPKWGTKECDVALRVLHYAQHNSLWGGASKIWIEKLLGTPFEISGGRNLTYKWQDLFFTSDFGEGYDFMMGKFLVDYLTLNRGGFLEKVSYGNPETPIRDGAKILGLNHLDALRIYFTGNREYPYLYASEWDNKLHKLHYTRVIHIAEQPSPNTLMFGMGKSALYDAMSVVNSQILLGKHQNELLNDLPPPGIVIFNNVRPDEVTTAMSQFEYERVRDGQSTYRAPLQLNSKDPKEPATVTFVPMSTTPEDFDYEKYMRIHVNVLALTLQLDPQDIWPLQSAALGSGMQSKILEQKSSAKGPGYLLTRLEREFNTTIPRPLEFEYKAPNAQADMQIATTAKTWVDVVQASSFMTDDEKRQLIANQVPAYADVLLDENGQVRLFDADPKTMAETEIIAGDAIELDASNPDQTDVTAGSEQQSNAVNNPTQTQPTDQPTATSSETDPIKKKDIDATGDAYTEQLLAIIKDAMSGTITQSTAGSRFRGIITKYGKLAYQDGLEEAGVDPNELDEDDLRIIGDDNVRDSVHVTDLFKEIYSAGGLQGDPEIRAGLWISTLNHFYYDGIASGDRNGMYEFVGDDGAENCDDCKRLKGQVHRMKDWVRKQLRPGVDHDNFKCGTWEPNCQHYLQKTTGKSKGGW